MHQTHPRLPRHTPQIIPRTLVLRRLRNGILGELDLPRPNIWVGNPRLAIPSIRLLLAPIHHEPPMIPRRIVPDVPLQHALRKLQLVLIPQAESPD
ncbi:hypothetical protein KC327_g13 [Hortaea werneckii]|nr:hypothetical protein KC327_g13 [Hortaea werneckii]